MIIRDDPSSRSLRSKTALVCRQYSGVREPPSVTPNVTMHKSSRLVFALVIFCFFISGMAGLIYQLAWMRYLALFLGHTSYAVVAVLVAFMGGLAIGNALFGSWADKSARPLALYAWLEIGIGLYALVFPDYYTFCHEAYIGLARRWQPDGTSALLLKFVFSFAAILLPAMLMGATLPVLTRFVTRSLTELRERVAALYAINSAGAVAGCIVADFWWIPAVGLEFTVFGAAALNFLAGLIAIVVSFRTGESSPQISEPAANANHGTEQFSAAELRWAIWAIGVSGFVAMLYEVAWTRLLALALGSSTHAFSLMLITFIAGIAVGAWIVYRWKSLRQTLRAFAVAELALAATVFASMFFYELLPFWFLKLASLLARRPEAYPLYELFQALICFGVMFVPTVCLGLTLPLVSRIATAELSRTGRSVGKVFAVNTLGTVLGTVATGLWLMPQLGLAQTFGVGVALNAGIGLAILMRDRLRWSHFVLAPLGVAALAWIAGLLLNDAWQGAFSLGLWRQSEVALNRSQFQILARAQKLKFATDGASSSVVVLSAHDGQKEVLALKVNGKSEASTGLDVSTQVLIGHIPMLLRPQSRHALVVGLGSGMTASAVARHPSIQRLDVVEISPDVVEAARFFAEHNDRVHENPRVRIVLDDAKSFLRTTTNRYDVLISEPSNPWMAGVAGVFTREYYESCRDRLQTNGLILQWVQIYETDDETLNLVLRTFTSVFPFVSIWRPGLSDLALVGSAQPFEPDMGSWLRRFEEPSIKSDLGRIEIDRPVQLLAREVISGRNGAFIVPPEGPVHSDFFPELEFRAQKAFFVKRGASAWTRFDENYSTRPSTLLANYLKERPLTEADLKSLARFHLTYRMPDDDLVGSILLRWRHDFPNSTLPLELSTQLTVHGSPAELEAQRHRPLREHLLAQADRDPEPLRLYAGYLMPVYRAQRSVFFTPATDELEEVLRRLIQCDPANQRVYNLYLAELAWDRGDDGLCLALGFDALTPKTDGTKAPDFKVDRAAPIPVLTRMIESLWRARRFNDALELCRQAIAGGYAERDAVVAALCRKVLATGAP